MKSFMAMLVCSISLLLSFAYADPQDTVYVNGIQNTKQDAFKGKDEMQLRLNTSLGFTYDVELVYNPIGWYGDEDGPNCRDEALSPSVASITCMQDSVELFHLKSAEEQFISSFDLGVFDFEGFTQPLDGPNFGELDSFIVESYAEYFDDLSKSVLPDNSLSDEVDSLQTLWSADRSELDEQRVRYRDVLDAYVEAKQTHADTRDTYNALEPTDPGYDDAEQAYAEAQVALQDAMERAQYTYDDVLYSLNIWSDNINATTYQQAGVDFEAPLEAYRASNAPKELVVDEYVDDIDWSYYINLLDVVSPVLPKEMFAEMQKSADNLYRKIRGNAKTVVVAHSEGNILANLVYAKTAYEYGEDVWKKLRVVNVGSVSELSPNELQFTHKDDRAIYGITGSDRNLVDLAEWRGWMRTTDRCQSTVCEFTAPEYSIVDPWLSPEDEFLNNHSFVHTYLNDDESNEVDVAEGVLDEVYFHNNTNTFAERFVDVVDAASASFPERVQQWLGSADFYPMQGDCYESYRGYEVCYDSYISDVIYAPYSNMHVDISYDILDEFGSDGRSSIDVRFGEGWEQYVWFELDEYGASINYTGGNWVWVDDVGMPKALFGT